MRRSDCLDDGKGDRRLETERFGGLGEGGFIDGVVFGGELVGL